MPEIIASTAAAQQTIERNFRWNFLVNTLDGASFWFGMSFLSSTVILPLFVSHFTNNPLLIGLISFLSTAGYLLPPREGVSTVWVEFELEVDVAEAVQEARVKVSAICEPNPAARWMAYSTS